MAESTIREALIAELLGDVGRLHDEVKALENRLPELFRELEGSITDYQEGIDSALDTKIAKLELIGYGIKENSNHIEGIISSTTQSVMEFMEIVKSMEYAIKKEINDGFARVEKTIEMGATNRQAQASKSTISVLDGNTRIIIWIAGVVVALGLVGMFILGQLFGPVREISVEEARYIEAGRDIIEVMPKLPGDIRKKLEAAFRELHS